MCFGEWIVEDRQTKGRKTEWEFNQVKLGPSGSWNYICTNPRYPGIGATYLSIVPSYWLLKNANNKIIRGKSIGGLEGVWVGCVPQTKNEINHKRKIGVKCIKIYFCVGKVSVDKVLSACIFICFILWPSCL